MRVIIAESEDPVAEQKLAAWMLCLEHGALAYSPDLAPRPPPHAPWPLLTLPPRTKAGLAARVHYRPAVGIVFHTEPAERLAGLMQRLQTLLEAEPAGHLAAAPVGASPVTVTRSCVEGKAAGRRFHIGAALPPSFADDEDFAWHFLPAHVVFNARRINGMRELNAQLASLFYDTAGCTRFADGAETYVFGEGNLVYPPVPRALRELASMRDIPRSVLVVFPPREGARAGRLLLTSAVGPSAGVFQDVEKLPAAPWVWGSAGADVCCVCVAPAGGVMVAALGSRAAAGAALRPLTAALVPLWPRRQEFWPRPARTGALDALLCESCWGAIVEPKKVESSLGCQFVRTEAPFSQAEACARTTLAPYAPLLAAMARPTAMDGTYLLRGNGWEVLLAPGALGPLPNAKVCEGLFAQYPAFLFSRIACAPGEWPAGPTP